MVMSDTEKLDLILDLILENNKLLKKILERSEAQKILKMKNSK